MKENLKPYAYKQTQPRGGVVLFVERAGELLYYARLSGKAAEPKRKRVLRGRIKYSAVDPKPDDLTMSRLKQR